MTQANANVAHATQDADGPIDTAVRVVSETRLTRLIAQLLEALGDIRRIPAAERFSTSVVRFGTFELDRSTGELRRAGLRVPLQDQPAQVLSLLVTRPGDLVTRVELRRALWSEDTFVEFDTALNVAVSKIRQALRDSARSPRFVETLPRRGYRFLAEVHAVAPSLVTAS